MCGNVSNSDRLERTFKQGLKSPLGNLGLIGLEQTTRFTGGSDCGGVARTFAFVTMSLVLICGGKCLGSFVTCAKRPCHLPESLLQGGEGA